MQNAERVISLSISLELSLNDNLYLQISPNGCDKISFTSHFQLILNIYIQTSSYIYVTRSLGAPPGLDF